MWRRPDERRNSRFFQGVCLKSQTFPSENQELALGRVRGY